MAVDLPFTELTMLNPAIRLRTSQLICGLAAAASLAAARPALAQPVVGEVVVIGRGGEGPSLRSLSAPVSYADLDLTTAQGRAVLHDRIRATAADLCRRLGDQNMTGSAILPSCVTDAVDAARAQEREAYALARPPVYAFAPPPPAAYVPPPEPSQADEALAAPAYAAPAAATVVTQTVTNGPVPDTPQNRTRFGGPISNGGRRTAPAGN
jgi:UrcA family protein